LRYDAELLNEVPHIYLVPDPKMLPDECIRFFQIDTTWLACLLDGPTSIGLAQPPHDQCTVSVNETKKISAKKHIPDGWMVRGLEGVIEFEVVNDHEHHGKSDKGHIYGERMVVKLPLLRLDHLAQVALLAVFHGKVEAVDAHMKPEAIHFGISERHHENCPFYKELRYGDGYEDPGNIFERVLFQTGSDAQTPPVMERDLDIHQLVYGPGCNGEKTGLGQDINWAQFALQMVEGVDRDRFDLAGDAD
jgi:hypothetical protein